MTRDDGRCGIDPAVASYRLLALLAGRLAATGSDTNGDDAARAALASILPQSFQTRSGHSHYRIAAQAYLKAGARFSRKAIVEATPNEFPYYRFHEWYQALPNEPVGADSSPRDPASWTKRAATAAPKR